MTKPNISKDPKLYRILNSKKLYAAILIISVIYLFIDNRILNEPVSFVIARWLLAAVFVLGFCYSRFVKFRSYYLKQVKSPLSAFMAVILISFFIIISQAVLSIPVDLFIGWYARDSQVEYRKCPISNVITTGTDKIHFRFLDKTYSRYAKTNGLTRNELIKNYSLVVWVKKSIGNSYYLESFELEAK